MCRLFGLIANKEVDVEFSFLKANKSFKELGFQNLDGWGIGYYKNGNPKITKEPISIEKSLELNKIIKQRVSNIFISHVRKSSGTEIRYVNTHPFGYRKLIFTHNGTVDIKNYLKEQLLSRYTKYIKGETDSEIFFFLIIQNIEQNKSIIEGIKETISFIKRNKGSSTTSLNFLLTNGKKTYALRKAFNKINNYSLFYLDRDPKKVRELNYNSEQTRLLIRSKRLYGERAIVICSEQLTTDEEWIPFSNGELMIVDNNLKISKEKV